MEIFNSKILSIIGLSLGFIGAVILTIGAIQSKAEIEAQSATGWGHNPSFRSYLFGQRKLAIWGLGFLTGSFIVQLWAKCIE